MAIKFRRTHNPERSTFTTEVLIPAGVVQHVSLVESMVRRLGDFGACSRFPADSGEKMSFEFLSDHSLQVVLTTKNSLRLSEVEGLVFSTCASGLTLFNHGERVKFEEVTILVPPEVERKLPH